MTSKAFKNVTTLNGIESVTNFGAKGDGIADDTNAIQSALDVTSNLGQQLVFPAGVYKTTGTLSLLNGRVYNLVGQNAKIITTAANIFNNFGASMYLDGLTFEGPTRGINFPDATNQCDIVFVARNCTFLNFGNLAIRSATTQTNPNSFTQFTLEGCLFDGNRNDILLQRYNLTDVLVTGNRFQNGGPESCNFQGGPLSGTRYIFDGNIYFNYLNNLSGSDPDGHFIRCYGERAIISNNIFDTLNVAVGTLGGDTEALRPQCNKIIVTGNIFRNAGMAEAVVVLKGSRESIVSDNLFICTDDYNAQAIARGFYTVGVLVRNNAKIIGNTFENFNGAVVDTEDGIPNIGTIVIENNLLINCRCNQYSSSQVFRLTAQQTKFIVRGNVIKTNETSEIYPVNIFRTSASQEIFVENNNFKCTGTIFENTSNTTSVYCSGNTYEEATRIIGTNAYKTFVSVDDKYISSSAPSFVTIFGNNRPLLNFSIENLYIDFQSLPETRIILVRPSKDCVGSFQFDFQFLETGNLASAVHRGSGFMRSVSNVVSIDALVEDNFYELGSPTLTKVSPAIVSSALVFRRPGNATNGTAVQGTFSLKLKALP